VYKNILFFKYDSKVWGMKIRCNFFKANVLNGRKYVLNGKKKREY